MNITLASAGFTPSADLAVESFFPLLSFIFIFALLYIWRERKSQHS